MSLLLLRGPRSNAVGAKNDEDEVAGHEVA
jgi:hypothetical protein